MLVVLLVSFLAAALSSVATRAALLVRHRCQIASREDEMAEVLAERQRVYVDLELRVRRILARLDELEGFGEPLGAAELAAFLGEPGGAAEVEEDAEPSWLDGFGELGGLGEEDALEQRQEAAELEAPAPALPRGEESQEAGVAFDWMDEVEADLAETQLLESSALLALPEAHGAPEGSTAPAAAEPVVGEACDWLEGIDDGAEAVEMHAGELGAELAAELLAEPVAEPGAEIAPTPTDLSSRFAPRDPDGAQGSSSTQLEQEVAVWRERHLALEIETAREVARVRARAEAADELEVELGAARARAQELSFELERTDAALASEHERQAELHAELERLREQHAREQAALEQRLEGMEDLERELETSAARAASLDLALAQSAERIGSLEAARDQARQEGAAQRSEIERLTVELAEASRRSDEWRARSATFEAEREARERELAERSEQLESLSEALRMATDMLLGRIAELEEDERRLEESLRSRTIDLEATNERLSQAQQTLSAAFDLLAKAHQNGPE